MSVHMCRQFTGQVFWSLTVASSPKTCSIRCSCVTWGPRSPVLAAGADKRLSGVPSCCTALALLLESWSSRPGLDPYNRSYSARLTPPAAARTRRAAMPLIPFQEIPDSDLVSGSQRGPIPSCRSRQRSGGPAAQGGIKATSAFFCVPGCSVGPFASLNPFLVPE